MMPTIRAASSPSRSMIRNGASIGIPRNPPHRLFRRQGVQGILRHHHRSGKGAARKINTPTARLVNPERNSRKACVAVSHRMLGAVCSAAGLFASGGCVPVGGWLDRDDAMRVYGGVAIVIMADEMIAMHRLGHARRLV